MDRDSESYRPQPTLSPDGRKYAFVTTSGDELKSVELYRSTAACQPWVHAGAFQIPADNEDLGTHVTRAFIYRIGLAWSHDSNSIFVATGDRLTLWKLDATAGLSVVCRHVLQFVDQNWRPSTVTVSETGEFLLLKTKNMQLHVFNCENLHGHVELEHPQDCLFIGKGVLGTVRYFKLRGPDRPALGWPSAEGNIRGGWCGDRLELCRFGKDMLLRRPASLLWKKELDLTIFWYSLSLGRYAAIRVESNSERQLSESWLYDVEGDFESLSAFDGRWLVFPGIVQGVFYCVDTWLLAAFEYGPLTTARFHSATRRISFPGSVTHIEAVARSPGPHACERPRLLLSGVWFGDSFPSALWEEMARDQWVAYIEGNELIPEARLSSFRPVIAGRNWSSNVVTPRLIAKADGMSAIALKAGTYPIRHTPCVLLKDSYLGPGCKCYEFLPRNQGVLSRWLAKIDAGIERRSAGSQRPGSWLSLLAYKAPDALQDVLGHLSLDDRAIAALAYPDLAVTVLGPRHMRLTILDACIERSLMQVPASLCTLAGTYRHMEDAALALLITLTASGDRDALRVAIHAYRLGIGGASKDTAIDRENRTMAEALAARLSSCCHLF